MAENPVLVVPNEWRVHIPSSFDTINRARSTYPLGYVYPPLREFFSCLSDQSSTHDLDNVLNSLPHGEKTPQQYICTKIGILLSYLEAYYNSVSPAIIRIIVIYAPVLCCTQIVGPLLNSLNIDAVKEMEKCGYLPDIKLAQAIIMSLVDAEYEKEELLDITQKYTPVVDYLISKGFGSVINHNIFTRI